MILSAVYMLWMFQRVNYGELRNEHNRSLPDLTPREWAMVIPIVAMAIFMGVLPNVFLHPMEASVNRVIQRIVDRQPTQVAGAAGQGLRHARGRPVTAPGQAGSARGRPSEPSAATIGLEHAAIMTDYAAIIPLLIVALAGASAMLAEAFRQPGERMPIAGLGLIGLAGAAVASVFLWDTDRSSFGVIRADNFSLFINIMLCVVGVLTMLFSNDVVEREHLPPGEYYALTLFAICGMMMMAAATDLLVMFIALEILSLAVYVLTGIRRASATGAEAAFKYFLLGSFSSAFFLYGIAFMFAVAGSTRLEQISMALSARAPPGRRRSRSWASGCWRWASRSRCPRCRSTCGRPTPTRARRRS